jgi:predicted CXXCH cytochrome family protein
VLGDSFSTEGHPTRDRQDPVRIGKELTCSSCHNPHASNSPNLWAFDVQSTFELCVKCHYDKL